MIYIDNLSFKYERGKRLALDHITLNVEEGDFVGIIGNSGAGKTTLINAINGLVPHHYRGDFYGRVSVGGLDTVECPPERLSSIVGSVFQDVDGHMVASMVEDELLFALENFSVPHFEIEERISWALDAVGIPSLRHRAISTLSGGQKQKVAFAAILALKPRVMVLDEPTAELDPKSSRQVFEVLKELNESLGMTIIIVEQKIMLLCEFSKRLAVLNRGKIACEGTVSEVLRQGELLYGMGINVPRVASLALALGERGLYNGPAPADVDSAEAMVREVLL